MKLPYKKTNPNLTENLEVRSNQNKIKMLEREIKSFEHQLTLLNEEDRMYPRIKEELFEARKKLARLQCKQRKQFKQ